MKRDGRLLFGVWASAIFAAGLALLPLFVPGYDPVLQTVSEIGEMTSPMRWPFAVMLWLVALCLLTFAAGVWSVSRQSGRNPLSALLIAWMGIAAAAIGVFAHPHSLHNVFGLSELIAYQAPLALALAWRKDERAGATVSFSWLMYVLLLASIAINLSTLARDSAIFAAIAPYYGIVQRALFACFFLWTAGVGWMLWRTLTRAGPASEAAPSRPAA